MESLDWARAVVAAMRGGSYPCEDVSLPRGNFEVLDMVAKRNIVFVSWQQGEKTGTWVMGFERDGTLTQLSTVA